MVQAVSCGPHDFNIQGKESSPTLQERLIQTKTGGLVQGKDFTSFFTRNCLRPRSLSLSEPEASCLSIAPQRSSPGEPHGVAMVCRHGVSAAAAVTPTLQPS